MDAVATEWLAGLASQMLCTPHGTADLVPRFEPEPAEVHNTSRGRPVGQTRGVPQQTPDSCATEKLGSSEGETKHFPTDAKERERLRKNKDKAAGIERKVTKRK